MSKSDKAAPAKGAAARSEIRDEPKAVEFRGINLTLPQVIPGAILFDIAEAEADDGNLIPIFRALRSILGDQVNELRKALADESLEQVLTVVDELLGQIFAQYGTSSGESEASPDS